MKSETKRLPASKPKRLVLHAEAMAAVDAGAPESSDCVTAGCWMPTGPHDSVVPGSLQQTEERFLALFEGVETGVFIIDPETHTLIDVNLIAARMVGAPREKIVGNLCHKFVCPADSGRCPDTDLGQTVDNSERALLTADGQRREIIKTVRPIVVSGRPLLLESFLDITALKNTEKALKERTAYLDSLIEVTPLGVLVLDAKGRVEMSNAAFERLFLYLQAEPRGVGLSDLIIPGELAAQTDELTLLSPEQGSIQVTTRRRRKDGTLVDVQIFAVRLEVDDKPHGFLALYQDISSRIEAERSMAERAALAALAGEMGVALTGSDNLRQGLQRCVEIMAAKLDVAFARIWTVNEKERMLELQASAGVYTRVDGSHARVSVGSFKIGRIAEIGEPHLSNNVLEDSWLADPQWARREGMVAFAGYPLKVKERVLGVMAAFARQPLTDAALETFASVADSIAQFIERKRAEESLRRSEDQFRTAFEEAPYGMCLTAPNGRFMHANAALCAMLGYSAEELQNGAWQHLTHPEDMEHSRQASVKLNSGDCTAVELEKRYIHKSGSVVCGRAKIQPIRAASGEISHFITQIEDITLRRQADADQAFLASLVESSPDAIVAKKLDGTVMSWNRGAQSLYGYTAEEIIGKPISLLVLPDRADELQQTLDAAGRNGLVIRYETVRVRKDGILVDVALTLSPVRDASGKVTGIATIAHDITDRALREQQTQLQTTALESTANSIVITDSSGQILWVNAAFTRLTGYAAEEVLGQNPRTLKSGIHDDVFYRNLWSTISRGDTWQGEIINRRKDGSLYTEDMTVTPVRSSDGSIHHFVAVKQDITERKRTQEELLFKTTLLETEAETTIDGILVVDKQGQRLQSNRRFAEMFRIPSEVIDRNGEKEMLACALSQVQNPEAFIERVQ